MIMSVMRDRLGSPEVSGLEMYVDNNKYILYRKICLILLRCGLFEGDERKRR